MDDDLIWYYAKNANPKILDSWEILLIKNSTKFPSSTILSKISESREFSNNSVNSDVDKIFVIWRRVKIIQTE